MAATRRPDKARRHVDGSAKPNLVAGAGAKPGGPRNIIRMAAVSATQPPSTYRELVERTKLPDPPPPRRPEDELDDLLAGLGTDTNGHEEEHSLRGDPLQKLRQMMVNELVPAFADLVEKYSRAGLSMQMDASNFLDGGRELRFEFAVGDFRSQLLGTVTSEAIAFHETRYSPHLEGELVSGPMLRLRGLTTDIFRQFICERLTLLLRTALRRR